MSGRLLSFSQFLGGADNVKIIEMFPSSSSSYNYAFAQSVQGWTFESVYQTLLLDQVSYDRVTGQPNFTDTNVIGYWASYTDSSAVTVDNALNGDVIYRIKDNRYSGPIFPNARENVVMTVAGFSWTRPNGSTTSTESHRWGIIERYLPGDNTPGDPKLDANFIPYGVGAVVTAGAAYNAGIDGATIDQVFTFTDDGSAPRASGSGLRVSLKFYSPTASPEIGILSPGTGYRAGDIIEIPDEALPGNDGTGLITVSIATVS